MIQHKQVLVPFASLPLSAETFESACTVARALSAEIVLLRVNPPIDPATQTTDCESLYSELKALQTQLRVCDVAVKIETANRGTGKLTVPYAAPEDVDFVIISGRRVAAQPCA